MVGDAEESVTFARLCEHRELKAHAVWGIDSFGRSRLIGHCPGGVVLDPEQTITWCTAHNAEQTGIYAGGYDSFCWKEARHPDDARTKCRMVNAVVVLDALAAAQEGPVCGSFGCTLPVGHNMGKADIPANHRGGNDG